MNHDRNMIPPVLAAAAMTVCRQYLPFAVCSGFVALVLQVVSGLRFH